MRNVESYINPLCCIDSRVYFTLPCLVNLSRDYVGVPPKAVAKAAGAAFAELHASGAAAALEGRVGAGNRTAFAEWNSIFDRCHLARLHAAWGGELRLLLCKVAARHRGLGCGGLLLGRLELALFIGDRDG